MLICIVALIGCRTRRQMDEIGAAIGALEPMSEASGAGSAEGVVGALLRTARVVARGATALAEPTVGELGDGSVTLDAAVPLVARECYTLIAQADAWSTEFSLALDDPTGRRVADAASRRGVATIGPVCAQQTGDYLMAVAAAHRGMSARVALGAWRHADVLVGDVADRIALRARRISPLATPVGAVLHDALEAGRAVEVPMALVAGECRLVVGTSEGSGADFDIELLDGNGGVSMRDIGVDRDPALGPFCTRQARMVRVRLRAYSRTGVLYWRSWRTDDGALWIDDAAEASGQ